jgi:hypothetical protein
MRQVILLSAPVPQRGEAANGNDRQHGNMKWSSVVPTSLFSFLDEHSAGRTRT